MLSKLRRRYGAVGPVAILALIVAVAFAGVPAVAQPVATTSANVAKQIRKALGLAKTANKRAVVANKRSINAIKLARNGAGTPGPAGPAGPQGPKGDKGDPGTNGQDGAPGQDGQDGADGNSVLSGAIPPGAGDGVDGDFYIDTTTQEIYGPKAAANPNNGWGFPTSLKGADGANGSPWTLGGTLPSGETLTGAFSGDEGRNVPTPSTPPPVDDGQGGKINGKGYSAISFLLPLATAPEFVFVKGSEDKSAEGCPGIVNGLPTADSGKLCVYLAPGINPLIVASVSGAIRNPNSNGAALGATSRAGAILELTCAPSALGDFPCPAFGVWAVTGN